ncbi:hypothetical protein IscW_ISCW002124 [Ixodes scapularis]|uniref:Uncharacterized protein n=1 Tax=Ixodes scapularis TaxID=6945 RepID=B7P7U5_IXOSC|nr:hypothetical protein IscW_ISCW002124 [Ixodes scapularis]|eukprot:XP_002399716.1 hypothetical protein IscW_ISCW002124 [Ixodes scapularis]
MGNGFRCGMTTSADNALCRETAKAQFAFFRAFFSCNAPFSFQFAVQTLVLPSTSPLSLLRLKPF